MTHGPAGFTHRFEPAAPDVPLTVLLLHGTGGDEHDLIDLGRAVAPGAALLSPRGQVLEGGMPRFFRRLAPGVFDEGDLIRRTHELADFVESACAAYGRDPARVVAVGYSNGANIAAAVLLLRPRTLAAAALLRPMLPLRPPSVPDLRGRPVLIAGGLNDPLVPRARTDELVDVLRQAGAEVTVSWRPGGHGLTPDDIAVTADWLARQSAGRASVTE
ncbi:MAG: alpha/beta hydrolase [Armatimonadota bacterium]|nr:alpha/beta hydrolase [Armatimonadota bacterium]MDR7402677.1 alpha/beta hydrolase [Armatimonadota bacterium]MDR7404450.1 alpha/beta hydrolase [Armatimonadota bacterium]MDR7437773.1 alpha/beta hydrolase [Armatimonadota bacterium]MDR7473264.1 alpha/beta hydrolase [Armatimonadota bacterium]